MKERRRAYRINTTGSWKPETGPAFAKASARGESFWPESAWRQAWDWTAGECARPSLRRPYSGFCLFRALEKGGEASRPSTQEPRQKRRCRPSSGDAGKVTQNCHKTIRNVVKLLTGETIRNRPCRPRGRQHGGCWPVALMRMHLAGWRSIDWAERRFLLLRRPSLNLNSCRHRI